MKGLKRITSSYCREQRARLDQLAGSFKAARHLKHTQLLKASHHRLRALQKKTCRRCRPSNVVMQHSLARGKLDFNCFPTHTHLTGSMNRAGQALPCKAFKRRQSLLAACLKGILVQIAQRCPWHSREHEAPTTSSNVAGCWTEAVSAAKGFTGYVGHRASLLGRQAHIPARLLAFKPAVSVCHQQRHCWMLD